MIPITSVTIDEDAVSLVLDVLRSGQLAQGPMVARLEREFAAIAGVSHAVALSNGTVSLVAALRTLGVGPGDEVVTSPFTFVATVNAVLEVGATVRFADIDLDDYLVDPIAVKAAVTERTRVLMPVHLYGQMADMTAIATIAEEHDLALVEDAAQAHGATCDGRPAGSFGIGSFSFYATKNVTTGEGGMLTTNDHEFADRLRLYRNQGMRARYQHELAGTNLRMTDLQAAIGIPQLARLSAKNDVRRANARRLTKGLSDLRGLHPPIERHGRDHVYHQYTVRVDGDAPLTRDELAKHLERSDVGYGVYYPRVVFDYECYDAHPLIERSNVPNAVEAAASVLSLPVHPGLDSRDLDRIVEVVRAAWS